MAKTSRSKSTITEENIAAGVDLAVQQAPNIFKKMQLALDANPRPELGAGRCERRSIAAGIYIRQIARHDNEVSLSTLERLAQNALSAAEVFCDAEETQFTAGLTGDETSTDDFQSDVS